MPSKKIPKKTERTPRRSGDQTTLTISLSKELKAFIEGAAKTDNRSVSNYLTTELSKLIKPP